MNGLQRQIVISAIFVMLACSAYYASADGHKHRKKHRQQCLDTVTDPTYKEQCGSCHGVYQPGLLPSGSWEKIMLGLDKHFGETVQVDPDKQKIIKAYLKSNAAEYSSAKLSAKIMRSLKGQTPLKITDIPYIRKKHHRISPDVLKNCAACHKTAESDD